MYDCTLTPEQEIKARTELCHEGCCLRCNTPLSKGEDRFLAQIPFRTKKHQYVNCFVVCHTCYEDKKGTVRWWDSLEDWQLLDAAKDRACVSITIR
jgi:hypothetical protein